MEEKRIKNIFEIIELKRHSSLLIMEFMAASCREDAAAINEKIKANAARIAELEKEQCEFAHRQLVNMFKGR